VAVRAAESMGSFMEDPFFGSGSAFVGVAGQ
jgi:hypothetical protein